MAERRTSSPRAHARADRARGRGAKAPTGGRAARTGDRRGDLGPHLVATRPERTTLLGRRLEQNPLITARDVKPSHPDLEVVSVFNAATAQVDGQTVLLMRVAERPRTDIDPPDNAQTLDLDGPHPVLRPLPRGYSKHDVIGMCYLDTERDPARVVVAYIPKNLPGLDLRDPRSIRYRNSTGVLRMINDGYTDYLAQISHLRVARSDDGIAFKVDEMPALSPQIDMEEYGVEDPRATFVDGRWPLPHQAGLARAVSRRESPSPLRDGSGAPRWNRSAEGAGALAGADPRARHSVRASRSLQRHDLLVRCGPARPRAYPHVLRRRGLGRRRGRLQRQRDPRKPGGIPPRLDSSRA